MFPATGPRIESRMTRRFALLVLASPCASGQTIAAGQILVAGAALQDEDFAHTVIFLIQADEQAVAGLMLNRPLRRRSGEPQYYAGGPIAQGVRSLVRESIENNAKRICPGVFLLPGYAKAPDARIFLGYTGWTAGQLREEIGRGFWSTIACDPAIVFDPDPTTLWQRLTSRRA